MENRFNNRDFEQFVKQNADQYRMFPSEKVWNGIHGTLHTRRRWYGIGIALLLITVTAVTFVMVNNPGKNQTIADAPITRPDKIASLQNKPTEVFIAPAKNSNKNNSSAVVKNQPSILLADVAIQPKTDFTETLIANADENTIELVSPVISSTRSETMLTTAVRKNIVTNNKTDMVAAVPLSANSEKGLFTTPTDDTPDDNGTDVTNKSTGIITDVNLLTIESVVNSYQHKRKAKRLSLQLSFTPGISYRNLKENKAFIKAVQAGNAIPLANVYVPDVNNIVTHKPDMGFQLALTGGYPLSKNITLTGGLQFSISKYDIKAYSHPREVTTIALSNAAGGTNTVSAYTNYRNTSGGYNTNWLRNLYVSAGVPIGLELKVLKSKKGFVGVGGNVQPTFVLDNQSYLLSTDFKNYAEIPSLIRKWNINTGVEVFVANTTGRIQWRIGPQVRYQTMSSFKKTYPVQEFLFDYGLKLGIMLR